jgi:hypothetical protein
VPARAVARVHARVLAGQADRGAGPASNSGWFGRRLSNDIQKPVPRGCNDRPRLCCAGSSRQSTGSEARRAGPRCRWTACTSVARTVHRAGVAATPVATRGTPQHDRAVASCRAGLGSRPHPAEGRPAARTPKAHALAPRARIPSPFRQGFPLHNPPSGIRRRTAACSRASPEQAAASRRDPAATLPGRGGKTPSNVRHALP